MTQRFFGHPESPLFGVYHAPRGKAKSTRAVVLCPPIGQEFVRTHWALRMLANQLSRKGIHVLRFDYHGVGDSSGRVAQIDSLDLWTRNTEQAIEHLQEESGVQTVMLLGQRLGGLLAGLVAKTRPDVNSVVLWEPVINGQEYLDSLRKMHAAMLDLWVCKMNTPNDASQEEILGSVYCRSLLDEIERVEFDVGSIRQPQFIIDTPTKTTQYSHPEPSLQRVVATDRDGAWSDLRELETAVLRPDITRTIVQTVGIMFDRLDRFGVLDAQNSCGGATR